MLSFSSEVVCEAERLHLGEFGVYDIGVQPGGGQCQVETPVEPVNANLAILYCSLILIALGLVYHGILWAIKKRYTEKVEKIYRLARRHIGYQVHKCRNIHLNTRN